MQMEIWLTFVVAASIILIVPGPTVMLVLTHSAIHGKRAAFPLVAGVVLGDLIALILSLLGLGVLMATSAILFTIFKWVGAVYLIYMGVAMWRSKKGFTTSLPEGKQKSSVSLFCNALVVTTFNPKGILFFMAFFPQFMRSTGNNDFQLVLFGATFLVLTALYSSLFTVVAIQVRNFIGTPKGKRYFQLVGGTALVGAGLWTLSTQRST